MSSISGKICLFLSFSFISIIHWFIHSLRTQPYSLHALFRGCLFVSILILSHLSFHSFANSSKMNIRQGMIKIDDRWWKSFPNSILFFVNLHLHMYIWISLESIDPNRSIVDVFLCAWSFSLSHSHSFFSLSLCLSNSTRSHVSVVN